MVRRQHPFTLTHGFYAMMGGFAIPAIKNRRSPNMTFLSTLRWTIEYYDFPYLLENTPDLVPDLPETAITDRAGADGLRKALLVFQVLSFFLNFAVRWAHGLELSLLEVSTASRGLCCLATYVVWWSKPFNIAEPTMILPAGRTPDVVNLMVERFRSERLLDPTSRCFSLSKEIREC